MHPIIASCAQNKHATATGLANLMPDELSHDQITRLLNKAPQTSKDLWLEVKSDVREHESADDGVLAIDDMIAELTLRTGHKHLNRLSSSKAI